jgi:hypothetical protein
MNATAMGERDVENKSSVLPRCSWVSTNWQLSTTMANPSLGALTWWRKWAKKHWAIAAVGFSVAVFLFPLISNSWRDDDSSVNHQFDRSHSITADLVDLTLLHNAKDTGARTPSYLYNQWEQIASFFFSFEFLRILIFFFFEFAVCLDGSSPGDHFQKGFGSGSNNWVLHIEVFYFISIKIHVSNFVD